MKRLLIITALLTVCLSVDAFARRESLTPEQKARLQTVDRVALEAIALTDQGQADASALQELIRRRMGELGYTVVDPAQPHDVLLKVKCEQRKIWEGTAASGGDADLPDSPLRAWKGPACQLTYLLDGKSTQWRKEVRTEFPDAIKAAADAKAPDPGAYALEKLRARLEDYDFPVLLAEDWGQDERLLKLLREPKTPAPSKVRIIHSLGEMFSANAAADLQAALKDQDSEVPKAAAIALGNIGRQDSIEALVEMLKTGRTDHKVAAAKALGKVGALHGNVAIIPPLLEALQTEDLVLKTEVVWALGQLPDRRAYEPLAALQRSMRNMRTSDRHSQEGKLWDAVSYSLKQLDGFDQIN